MPFRFSLQSLLRFRQSIERHEQTQLEIANLKVTDMCGKIKSLEQTRDLRNEHQRHGLNVGLTGAELQFDPLCNSALASYRKNLEKELAQLEKLRDHTKSFGKHDCSARFSKTSATVSCESTGRKRSAGTSVRSTTFS